MTVPDKAPGETREQRAKASGLVAWLMDEVISVPGTKVKIGLDPVLGLLPGAGDFASSTVSCVALLEAMRRGIPLKVQGQMIGNILINAGFGSIPIVGDIFSVIFRSNSRNRDIINQHLRESVEAGRDASWWRVLPAFLFIACFVLVTIAINFLLWIWLANRATTWLNGLFPGLN